MGTVKISETKLKQMIRSGKSVQHCAQHFGVSISAIRQRLKKMDIIVSRSLCMDKPTTDKLVDEAFDASKDLMKIYKSTSDLLDRLESVQRGEMDVSTLEPLLGSKASVGDLQIKAIAEIRKQLGFMHDVQRHLFDMKRVQEFQNVVLQTIESCDPEVGYEIKRRLLEVRVLDSTLSLT